MWKNAADEAADFGHWRVFLGVIDARRNLSGGCRRRYSIVMDLHRFFMALSCAVVNHDDSADIAPDPLVWSAGAPPKRHRLVHAARNCTKLFGPGPIWESGWVSVLPTVVSADDVNACPLPRYRRPERPISVSAVPLGAGIDFLRPCRFIGALMRSLCTLLGGLGSFCALYDWPIIAGLLTLVGRSLGLGLLLHPETSSVAFLNDLWSCFDTP